MRILSFPLMSVSTCNSDANLPLSDQILTARRRIRQDLSIRTFLQIPNMPRPIIMHAGCSILCPMLSPRQTRPKATMPTIKSVLPGGLLTPASLFKNLGLLRQLSRLGKIAFPRFSYSPCSQSQLGTARRRSHRSHREKVICGMRGSSIWRMRREF